MKPSQDVHQEQSEQEQRTFHCLLPAFEPQDPVVTEHEQTRELRSRLLKMILENEQQRKLHDYSTPKVQLQIDA